MIKTEFFLEYRITYTSQSTGEYCVCFCKLNNMISDAIKVFNIPDTFTLEGFDGLNWKLINNTVPILV